MSNQLVKQQNQQLQTYSLETKKEFLQNMIDSGQLPVYIKKVETAFAIASMGYALGFQEMISFNYIISIQGKLTLSAKAQQAILRRHGVKWRTLEDYHYCYADGSIEDRKMAKKDADGNEIPAIDIRTVIEFERDGIKEVVKFYHSDAQAAQLLEKDVWKKYKKNMFWARCFTLGATRVGSDLLLGLYNTDEMFDALGLDEDMVVRNEKGEILSVIDTDYKEAE